MKSKILASALFALSLTLAPAALAQESKPAQKQQQKEHKHDKDGKHENHDKDGKHEKHADKAKVGEAAPAFTLTDTSGKEVKLSDFKDKVVVLEWFNPGCPVVIDMYKKGTMGKLYNEFKDKGVVFLAINSGGPGQQGHGTAANADAKKEWKIEYPILLDETGTVGKAYGATNTPHMFVIGKDGKLAYAGAIDDKKDKNYVHAALTEILAGKPVSTAETRAYGCSVKYAKK
ncbi:MAG: thioredoxin family protein [Phycisphaerales bacterium]